MSCVLSCSTDSGARKPCTVATLVATGAGAAAGAGGGAGATAAVDSGRPAVVSDVAGALSGRTQGPLSPPRTAQRVVPLLGDLPPPLPACCVAAPANGSPRSGGRRAGSSSSVETCPRRSACALPGG